MYIFDKLYIHKNKSMYTFLLLFYVASTWNTTINISIFSLLLNTAFFCLILTLMPSLNFKDNMWERLTNVGLVSNTILQESFKIHFPQDGYMKHANITS
jgi:hypothetical protein